MRGSDQKYPLEEEMQKGKMIVQGGLIKSWGKKRGKKKRYTHLIAEFQRIARRDRKAFLVINAKK